VVGQCGGRGLRSRADLGSLGIDGGDIFPVDVRRSSASAPDPKANGSRMRFEPYDDIDEAAERQAFSIHDTRAEKLRKAQHDYQVLVRSLASIRATRTRASTATHPVGRASTGFKSSSATECKLSARRDKRSAASSAPGARNLSVSPSREDDVPDDGSDDHGETFPRTTGNPQQRSASVRKRQGAAWETLSGHGELTGVVALCGLFGTRCGLFGTPW
jgi:hypothetical protein